MLALPAKNAWQKLSYFKPFLNIGFQYVLLETIEILGFLADAMLPLRRAGALRHAFYKKRK